MNPYSNPYAPPQAGDPYMPGDGIPVEAGAVPDTVVEQLRRTRGWVTFMAIVGFLGAGLLVLIGVVMVGAGTLGPTGGKLPAGVGLAYVLMGAFPIFPSLHLLRYGSAIGRLVRDPRLERLVVALGHQRSYWKLVGIMTAVMIALYPIAMVALVVIFAARGVESSSGGSLRP